MKCVSSTCPGSNVGTIAVVGSWDPLNSCHFSLWDKLAAEAVRKSLRPLVVTISPMPQAILRGSYSWPDTDDLSFTNFVQRLCGINDRVVISLEREDLKGCTGELIQYLRLNHNLQELWVGLNQTFGSGPEDSHKMLRVVCDQLDVAIVTMPFVASRIPSLAIRSALAAGKIGEAARLLGRPIFRAIHHGFTVYAPWKSGCYRGQLCTRDDFEFVRNEVCGIKCSVDSSSQ